MLPELKIVGLKKRFDGWELRADFSVRAGERLALVGPSGCGKTSLLRLLAGLETWQGNGCEHEHEHGRGRRYGCSCEREGRGGIWWKEMVFHKLPVEKRQVGFIFQDQALFLTASVMENVAFGLKVRGVRKGARRKEAEKWLAEAGLGHKVQARVDELSGGERQRVCWLRAMIWKPEILLLDEPFSGLDEGNRAWLEQLVTRKCPTAPLLFSTHHEVEIEQFAHKVLVCEQGSEQGLRISRFS